MLTIESAHSPVWADADGITINLIVKFAEFEEELPFAANDHDAMPYGRELFARAKAGEFGEVAPFVPFVPVFPAPNQPQTQGAQTL